MKMREEQEQATEIDQLLPTPVSIRNSYYRQDGERKSGRGWSVIAGIAILALAFSVHSILSTTNSERTNHRHRGNDNHNDHFKPKQQLGALQNLTENSLMGFLLAAANATPSKRGSRHPKGKVEVLSDKKHKNHHKENGIIHCTSQVMIMRHCDKEVKFTVHGKEHTTDNRDNHGDRHCSAKGKKRSEYIATLFVDSNDYKRLVKENGKEADGIPPVPMIKSSLSKVSSAAARKKPQFPSPLKLYALSSDRPADKPWKEHENFREIETITPLSNKFHLGVDERFGIGEEGDLASDFFEDLSKSATKKVDMVNRTFDETDSSAIGSKSNLCNSGMSIVNWKHSRIPILSRALGCGTDEGCPKKYKGHDYDTVWLLTFQYTLLLADTDDLDVVSSLLDLESSSKSSSSRRHKKNQSSGHGNWKITAELINEGFEVN